MIRLEAVWRLQAGGDSEAWGEAGEGIWACASWREASGHRNHGGVSLAAALLPKRNNGRRRRCRRPLLPLCRGASPSMSYQPIFIRRRKASGVATAENLIGRWLRRRERASGNASAGVSTLSFPKWRGNKHCGLIARELQ